MRAMDTPSKAGVAPSRGRGLKRTSRWRKWLGWRVAPSRGRGLKLEILSTNGSSLGRPFTGAWIETAPPATEADSPTVAPTGAWIETTPAALPPEFAPVAPSRGRGLKPHVIRNR